MRKYIDETTPEAAFDTYLKNWGKPPVLTFWAHLKGKKPTFNQWKVSSPGTTWGKKYGVDMVKYKKDSHTEPVASAPQPSTASVSAQLKGKKRAAASKYRPDGTYAVRDRSADPSNGMWYKLLKVAQQEGLEWFAIPVRKGTASDYIGTIEAALAVNDHLFVKKIMSTHVPTFIEMPAAHDDGDEADDTMQALIEKHGQDEVDKLIELLGEEGLLGMAETLL